MGRKSTYIDYDQNKANWLVPQQKPNIEITMTINRDEFIISTLQNISNGELYLILDDDESPENVLNFVRLIQNRVYWCGCIETYPDPDCMPECSRKLLAVFQEYWDLDVEKFIWDVYNSPDFNALNVYSYCEGGE